MKDYETYARKYPAIISMLIPAIVTTQILSSWFSQFQDCFGTVLSLIGIFVPVGVVYGAIGYFARQLFRDASKMFFQFPLFKEDETEMPTTKLLLWSDKKRMSANMIKSIAAKLKEDFGIKLLSEAKEQNNLLEAKKTIVDGVGKIREVTRNNPNLLQYNIDFGFCRNYLGGAVYSTSFLLIILFLNIFDVVDNWQITLIALAFQVLLGIIVFVSLKSKGYSYARALFNAYIGNSEYNW